MVQSARSHSRPPARDGLYPVRVHTPPSGPLSDALKHRFPTLPTGVVEKMFASGNVVDFRGRALNPDTDSAQVPQGVWIYRPIPDEPDQPIHVNILARGDGWIAVDKPHGLATMPRGRFIARSLTVALRRQELNDDIVCAHRLDRATAGVVLAITDPSKRGAYQQLFQNGEVAKTYLAVAPAGLSKSIPKSSVTEPVEVSAYFPASARLSLSSPKGGASQHLQVSTGRDQQGDFTRVRSRIEKDGIYMRNVPGVPNSETILRPASKIFTHEGVPGLRLWKVEPLTGRTHQIRVHFAGIGAPIVGDPLYGGALAAPYGLDELPAGSVHLQLLAQTLEFRDPFSGQPTLITSRQTLRAATALA